MSKRRDGEGERKPMGQPGEEQGKLRRRGNNRGCNHYAAETDEEEEERAHKLSDDFPPVVPCYCRPHLFLLKLIPSCVLGPISFRSGQQDLATTVSGAKSAPRERRWNRPRAR